MYLISAFTRELERVVSRLTWLKNLLFPYYIQMVKAEIELGRLTSLDRVMCIGGGSYPCTAILIAKETGARVDIIDIDDNAIENARRVVELHGLSHLIHVGKSCGTKVNAKDYSVVHIAKQAIPQERILKTVLSSIKEGTRIIIRVPKAKELEIRNEISCNVCAECSNYERIGGSNIMVVEKRGAQNEKAIPRYNRSGDNLLGAMAN